MMAGYEARGAGAVCGLDLKALGDKDKQVGNFLFQGARVALIRLADVSAAEVVSLVAKNKA